MNPSSRGGPQAAGATPSTAVAPGGTDPRRLAFLLAVHRTGGVLAAADVLGVTASAVSQQIHRLEAEEGVQVLDRGPRGVSLTPVGRVLADAAERIEAEMVDARKAIATMSDDVSGRVVVGSVQSAIRSVVAPVLHALPERFPGIDLEVQEAEPEAAMRGLRAGSLDLVLVERDSESDVSVPRGMDDVIVREEPWCLVTHVAFPTPTQLADLRDAPWLGAVDGTAAARALARVIAQVGGSAVTRHRYFDFDVALALVAAGQGVALLPALALQGELPDDVAVVRLPGLGSRYLVARHRSTRAEPGPATSTVLDELLAVAAGIEL
ncbi:LysR family transcriptional regulator [Paraoerskovia sediminicola]|uniref:LysR family transcriptional regulator n=1 Tax=Paraoerskovia sediminicola TaxID=1138587 RepID=A0ABN6XB24_9CELL|nr:LysR family transcriptional regulator [Paraoerskovia sediminicola]BDZ42157.1 LysR family transcriptional regulator [Paraoerskovia sediminicola]